MWSLPSAPHACEVLPGSFLWTLATRLHFKSKVTPQADLQILNSKQQVWDSIRAAVKHHQLCCLINGDCLISRLDKWNATRTYTGGSESSHLSLCMPLYTWYKRERDSAAKMLSAGCERCHIYTKDDKLECHCRTNINIYLWKNTKTSCDSWALHQKIGTPTSDALILRSYFVFWVWIQLFTTI